MIDAPGLSNGRAVELAVLGDVERDRRVGDDAGDQDGLAGE
jgi:hypothetical protein